MRPQSPESSAKRGPQPLRADAQRNRDRLLAAADALFSERGADASMDDVARRAKVGIGTLYRHFPTRESLLAATCDARLLTLTETTRSRMLSATPADALTEYLTALVAHASVYRGLAASFGVVLQNGSEGCHATTEVGRELLERAQAAGEIKQSVELGDIVCMATAISLAAQQSPDDAKRVSRLVAMFVDGLREARADHRCEGNDGKRSTTRSTKARTRAER